MLIHPLGSATEPVSHPLQFFRNQDVPRDFWKVGNLFCFHLGEVHFDLPMCQFLSCLSPFYFPGQPLYLFALHLAFPCFSFSNFAIFTSQDNFYSTSRIFSRCSAVSVESFSLCNIPSPLRACERVFGLLWCLLTFFRIRF